MRVDCGQSPPAGERKVPLAAMRSVMPLYVMERSGRLVKMDLGTGTRTTLSDHGFSMMPSLVPSGDGRWLSYSGVMKGEGKTQYWLYDRHHQTEQLVYEHPAWGGGIPAFSPDSRYLVVSAGYDRRWPDANRAGIFLFDTTTSRLRAVPLPAPKDAWVSADWSQDGKALLILVHNSSAKEGVDYFAYYPATKQVEAISGHYNRRASRHEFRRGAQGIPAAVMIVPLSQLGESSAWSPGRDWHAHIDERDDDLPYPLLVTSKDGVSKPVATGRYDQCSGGTLRISGWLDQRRLIYRNSMNYFIYDAQTGTTADLFSANEMPFTFTW